MTRRRRDTADPTPKREQLICIGYRRVSTGTQSDKGSSLAAQERALRAAANARGWAFETAEDRGISGKSMTARPGLTAAVKRLNAGEADILMATKLDRISRSVPDFGDLLDQATKSRAGGGRGWAVRLLEPDIDMTTPFGEAMAGVLVVFAQFERKMAVMRIRDGMAQKKLEGAVFGSPSAPLEVVERIRTARSNGDTYQVIADRLNAAGTPTSQGGAQWWPSSVRAVALADRTERHMPRKAPRVRPPTVVEPCACECNTVAAGRCGGCGHPGCGRPSSGPAACTCTYTDAGTDLEQRVLDRACPRHGDDRTR